jgi:hypothetical protein
LLNETAVSAAMYGPRPPDVSAQSDLGVDFGPRFRQERKPHTPAEHGAGFDD